MSDTEQRGEKRDKSDAESSDDDFVGPSITDAAPPKKKKVLEYEKVYLLRFYAFHMLNLIHKCY